MWRRLWRIFLITSVLFWLAIFFLCLIGWPMSHWQSSTTLLATAHASAYLAPGKVELTLHRTSPDRHPERQDQVRVLSHQRYPLFGFERLHVLEYNDDENDYQFVYLDFWALILASGLFSCTLIAALVFRRHRRSPGHCLACSYDLRAHKPGDKCPECGTIMENPAPARV